MRNNKPKAKTTSRPVTKATAKATPKLKPKRTSKPKAKATAKATPKLKPKPTSAIFTDQQVEFMLETYGRVLTPEEWAERKSRFSSGPEDITYTKGGILKV